MDYTKTSGYGISVNSGSTTNLTFDLNGNMTSDGTNSYAWDAENRMIKIAYPGSNNFSTFVFDGSGKNVSIIETVAGVVTSTKQFLWWGGQRREARNAAGTITERYYAQGEIQSSSNYFYTFDNTGSTAGNVIPLDHTKAKAGRTIIFDPLRYVGSVREMTNTTGAIQDQRSYDPYGVAAQVQGGLIANVQYAGYYTHSRSKLGLTRTRPYSSAFGRFLTRDSIEERGGVNLFAYVSNNPINFTDPTGRLPSGYDDCSCKLCCITTGASCLLDGGAWECCSANQVACLVATPIPYPGWAWDACFF